MTERHDNESKGLFIGAFASFLIPALVLAAVFAVLGIAPFGEKLLLTSLYEPKYDALVRLHSALYGSEGLSYSFSGGMGGNFSDAVAGGFISPFYLVTLFCAPRQIAYSMPFVIMLEACFAGLFAFMMLRELCLRDPYVPLVFACIYGVSGVFFIGFSEPQMMSAAVFLPLVGVGISRLRLRGSIATLITGASLFLFGSPGEWQGLVVFAAIYYVWFGMVCSDENGGRSIGDKMYGRLIASFIIAAGISAVLLLPMVLSRLGDGSMMLSADDINGVSLHKLLGGMFPGAVMPACGSTMLLAALPMYLFNRKLPLVERQLGLFFCLFLALCMTVPAVGWLMLCFGGCTDAGAGIGFLSGIMSLAMAARAVDRARDVKVGNVFASWMISAALFAIAAVLYGKEYAENMTVFIAAFTTVSAVLLMIAVGKKGAGRAFCILAVLCIMCEGVFGGYVCLGKTELVSVSEYTARGRENEVISNMIDYSERQSDNSGFYRVRSKAIAGKNCITQSNNFAFAEALGINGTDGFTLMTDSLFGVKYITDGRAVSQYVSIPSEGDERVWRNDRAMSIGFAASTAAATFDAFEETENNPFDAQNKLMSCIAGVSRQVFVKAEIISARGIGVSLAETGTGGYEAVRGETDGIIEFTVLAPTDGIMYMYSGTQETENIAAMGNSMGECRLDSAIELCGVSRGSEITIDVTVSKKRFSMNKVSFYVLDKGLADAALAQLREQQLEHLTVSGGFVRGTVTLNEGQLLLTTIPYNEGWSALVDGRKCEVIRAAGKFCAVEAGAGAHSIEMRYTPPGLILGTVLSIFFICIAVALSIAVESGRRRREREYQRRCAELARYEAASTEYQPVTDEVSLYRSYYRNYLPRRPQNKDERY